MSKTSILNRPWVKKIVFCLLDSPKFAGDIEKETGYPQPRIAERTNELHKKGIIKPTLKSQKLNERRKKKWFQWQINYNTLLRYSLFPKGTPLEETTDGFFGMLPDETITPEGLSKKNWTKTINLAKKHNQKAGKKPYAILPEKFKEYLKQYKKREKFCNTIIEDYEESTLETILNGFLDHYLPKIISKLIGNKQAKSEKLTTELKEVLNAIKFRATVNTINLIEIKKEKNGKETFEMIFRS
ncbi:MAG: hypothetical protein WCW13_03515 [archaeon]